MLRLVALIVLVLTMAGCGAPLPKKSEDQATDYVASASSNFTKGAIAAANADINLALQRSTGPEKVKVLFERDPQIAKAHENYLIEVMRQAKNARDVGNFQIQLERARPALSPSSYASILDSLNELVAKANFDGSMRFTLSDDIRTLPAMKTPEQRAKLADNTIAALQSGNSSELLVSDLMAYVVEIGGPSSAYGKHIASLLPTLNIRRPEVDTVARVYPEYADQLRALTSAKVLLQVEPSDRLFREELLAVLRNRIRGIEYVDGDGPGVVRVVVERLRYTETQVPARTETVTYSQYEVNLLAAALLMPRNASYIYDITTAGAEIEYAFAVKGSHNGKVLSDELTKDRIRSTSVSCTNARIQNVFGGTQRADFIANDDMSRRCAGGNASSIDGLRNDVLSRLAEQIAKLGPIASVQKLN